jgi:predicted P-loop ATPase
MKFFKLFAKKQRNNHAASDDVALISKNLMTSLTFAANLQGVTLGSEDVCEITALVHRSVAKATGTNVPGVENALPTSTSKKQEDDGKQYRGVLHRLEHFLLRYALRFNELTGHAEIAKRKEVPSEMVYHAVNDRDLSTIVQDIRCEGINFWTRDIQRYINSEKVTMYHPFLQYFEELPEWDGKDRVTPLAERVSSRSAWTKGFHRWMLGVTAQWMGYARKTKGACHVRANSVAPILISEQQGWGKSTFCRMLLPEALQVYYTDSFDVAQPSACEAKLMDYGLINLDEFDRIPVKRNAQLKNLMQMVALNIRKAYKTVGENRFRLASFIGTSNSRDLLSDSSGSRRFLCVELEHPIDCDTPIEYEQLYAQLKHEILSGERYWFSGEEEAEMQENNMVYNKTVTEEDLFFKMFRMGDRRTDGVEFLTADEIFKALKETYPTEMLGMTSKKLSSLLPTFAQRSRTNRKNGYWVVRNV